MLIYGVCISDIDQINEEKAVGLLHEFAKIDESPLKDYLGSSNADGNQISFDQWCYDYERNGHYGLAALLADIIGSVEGIDIECDDPNGIHYLGISADVPWNFNEKTRKLSCDDFCQILTKYINQVTDNILSIKWWAVSDDCDY